MKNLFSLLILLIFIGCNKKEEVPKSQRFGYQIVSGQNIPDFNAQNALTYIEKQLEFGPRNPNSPGHREAMLYLHTELSKFADTSFIQKFSYPGYNNERLELGNIIASFNPSNPNRILLCAHWDTRPRADKDKDELKRHLPILGANDGASGVAVLLELANVLKKNKVDYGIDIVFFDAEDYGIEGDLLNYAIGSKYFAQNRPAYIKPLFGILLDMVGDKNALFKREPNSMRFAPDIVDLVWKIAFQIGASSFSNQISSPIYNDHVPLGEVGMKVINVIDADLVGAENPQPERNYWHTHNDTIENISPKTLGGVGRVVLHLIYSLRFSSL
jgi:Zn-dependent M28 family amino/carboxypeptidase